MSVAAKNPSRQAPRRYRSYSREELIASRTRRAIEEAKGYEVRRAVKSGVGEGVTFWVVNAEKRSLHLVANGRCDCKDDELNRRVPGFACKHTRMVELELGVNDPLPADDCSPAPARTFSAEEKARLLSLWD